MKRLRKGVDWDVFETNSDDGLMQIQMVDEAGAFEDDEHAIRHVIGAAMDGSSVAIAALWSVIDEDGLLNRILWQMADPSITDICYPEGYYETWIAPYEDVGRAE